MYRGDVCGVCVVFFVSSRIRHTRCALVTGVQTCALPISRPATLRGLSPDQTLVLINGHRRHATSLITFNNGFYRGAVPVEYNLIPEIGRASCRDSVCQYV